MPNDRGMECEWEMHAWWVMSSDQSRRGNSTLPLTRILLSAEKDVAATAAAVAAWGVHECGID